VGFQVVLIVGQADVIVPENLSAAANYNCVRCLTYALANQLVLTLDGPLSGDGMARLNALWAEIAEFGRNLQNVPLSEIQGRLEAFMEQVMEIVRNDPSATKGTATSATPSSTATATPGSSQAPSPGATATPTVPAGATTADPAPAAPATGGAATETPAATAEPTITPTVTSTEPAPAPATPGPTSNGE
jgi:putative peptide zinc metalloprotease protein